MTKAGSARERILERLRSHPCAVPPAPTFAVSPTLSLDEAIADFRRGIEAFHAEVIDTRGSDWRSALTEVCTSKQIRRLLLPAAGPELAAWSDGPQIERFDRPIETFKADLFNHIDAGLTVADGAIAETGTLFQIDPHGTPRTLSLVPSIHICILDVKRILPSLQAAVASEGWQVAMPSNLIFITGPSKTADIQQTLAYGAHGPKELIVLLTEGS
jgi:L-lactate dehydrogenase complex protein LldG